MINGQKGWTSALLKTGAVIGAIIGGITLAPLIATAYAAYALAEAIVRLLVAPFVPFFMIVKVIDMAGSYIDKREKLKTYLRSLDGGEDAGRANAMRIDEAEKIVSAMEKMSAKNKNPKKGDAMPEELREQLIKYFADEKRDMKSLIDTAEDLERKAKKKSIDASANMGNQNGIRQLM